MTVKALIEMLSGFEPDRLVVLSKDSEGNSYSPLHGAWTGKYRPTTTWYGEMGLEGLDDEDIAAGFTEEDVFQDGERAVVLTPTN